jgi:parvulin-like peptidyl-prolyl isomerase
MADSKPNHDTQSDDPTASVAPAVRTVEKPKTGLPAWSPWAVLGLLLGTSLLVGFEALETPKEPTSAAKAEAASKRTTATTAPTATAMARSLASPSLSIAPRVRSAPNDPAISVLQLIVAHDRTLFGKRKNITRSAAEAKELAEKARARALKGEDFAALAAEYSDEPRAAEGQGSPLTFRYKDAVKPFADAAFALEPGQISAVVETPSGFQVIKRTQ